MNSGRDKALRSGSAIRMPEKGFAPNREFLGERPARTGRTGRRQAHKSQAAQSIAAFRPHVPVEQRFRRAAVKSNGLQARMPRQQRGDVVGFQIPRMDRRIQAAWPLRRMEHVPERDSARGELPQPHRIRPIPASAEQCAHEGPEGVARMGIIFPLPNRFCARQRPEDQHARALGFDRGKADRPRPRLSTGLQGWLGSKRSAAELMQ